MIKRILDFLHSIVSPSVWLRKHERAFRYRGGDRISTVIITDWALPGSMLKCWYEQEWYALITQGDWQKLQESLPAQPAKNLPPSPFSLSGVPVIEDDDLAQRVLISAIANPRNRQWIN